MRKLRKWERYVLFPKTKDNPLEGEIPLKIAHKEVKAHKAWPKPFAFIRPLFGTFTPLIRTTAVTASKQDNPFFGNPSTALRVGFDSLPKTSRSAVEQQSKTTRTRLEYMSKRSRRSLEQHPKECRTSLEQQTKKWDKVIFSIDASYRQHDMRSVREVLSSRFVQSCPEQVLPIRQVCVKYTLSNDIVLRGYSTKALISAVRWPYAMSILYKIADIFKAIAHKNGTSTIQNPYCANTADRDNTLPGTYQVRPASDRHGFSTASRRLRAPMAIGARSDNDQSAKPEMQNKGRRKVEQRENTVRTASGKNAINLRSLYQKATGSIRVTYQKYTLDLLKTYQRLTKKLPTAYHEVSNKWQAAYAKFKNNLHGFSKYCVALWCDNQLGTILITSRFSRSRALFCQPLAICFVTIVYTCVLFSEAQAQSVETRTVDGLTEIRIPEGGIVIGDSLPEAFWEQELQVIHHPQGLAKIKLSDYRDKLLVLDFLNTACVPCIASVDKWHQLQERYRQEVAVLPVHLYGDNQRIGPFAKKKDWTLPIAVGNTADTIINRLFYSYKSFGQVWIHDGCLLAIPHHKDVTPELIGKALRRMPLGIIMNDFLTYFDKRYTGGASDENSK